MSKSRKFGVALTSFGGFLLASATYLWLFTKPIISAANTETGYIAVNDADYFIGLSLLIFGILAVSVGLNYLAKNKPPEKSKLPFVFNLAGGLIGL